MERWRDGASPTELYPAGMMKESPSSLFLSHFSLSSLVSLSLSLSISRYQSLSLTPSLSTSPSASLHLSLCPVGRQPAVLVISVPSYHTRYVAPQLGGSITLNKVLSKSIST